MARNELFKLFSRCVTERYDFRLVAVMADGTETLMDFAAEDGSKDFDGGIVASVTFGHGQEYKSFTDYAEAYEWLADLECLRIYMDCY